MDRNVVLVVDDDETILEIIREVVASLFGANVTKASTGTQALALARELKPALVLLDVLIPEPNGLDVARALKSDAATSSTPIIALSAFRTRELAIKAGCDDFLDKPFDVDALASKVSEYLARPLAVADA